MEIDKLDALTRLNIESELANARLGVAEDLGWLLAIVAAIASHLAFHSWAITIGIGLATYYFCTLKFRRESATADDRYQHAAGLGKYYQRQPGSD
jgi:hypothetical protein